MSKIYGYMVKLIRSEKWNGNGYVPIQNNKIVGVSSNKLIQGGEGKSVFRSSVVKWTSLTHA